MVEMFYYLGEHYELKWVQVKYRRNREWMNYVPRSNNFVNQSTTQIIFCICMYVKLNGCETYPVKEEYMISLVRTDGRTVR